MRQRSRWKVVWFLALFELVNTDDVTRSRNVQKSLFSPRMDYNQWKPLGRGDPLKNDPTFDYVPPVLDHVHYWMDPEPRPTNPSNVGQKTEILLLGVSSKKPATSSAYSPSGPGITASDRRDTSAYDPYPKYLHQDKTTNFYNQRVGRPNYFPSMTSQIVPSLMSLASQVLERTGFSKGQESRTPYTVLMPPPMVGQHNNNNQFSEPLLTSPMTQRPGSFTPKVPPPVTVQESNLIYQSSSLGNQKEFESVPSISWELPSTTESAKGGFAYDQNLSPPKSFIRIQFSPKNKILEASDSNHNINYVTPPPLDDSQMTFKGQVSDDNDISDSYVKIEKPQAQMMDHVGVEIDNVHPMSIVFPHAETFGVHSDYPSMSMETIKDMEAMKPPPVTHSPVYARPTNPIVSALKNDRLESTNFIGSSSSISNTVITTSSSTAMTDRSETSTLIPDFPEITTIAPPSVTATIATTTEPITTMQTLTTDPLFKHYKQPVEPMKGPLYLIIQGHSKVKTYKPAKQIDGVMVQETNEIPYGRNRNVDYSIKHLHGYEEKEDFLGKADNIAKQRQARTGNLQTLKHVVETGLGAIDIGKEEEAEMRRRSDADVEETELEAGYEVVDGKDATSEKYRKGIVEEASKLN